MNNVERLIVMTALIALIVYVLWQMFNEYQASLPGTAAAPEGTVPATPPAIAASLSAVADTGQGPAWLLYNAPGIYNMGPPIVNTIMPPSQTLAGKNMATGPSALSCNSCGTQMSVARK